MTSVERVEVWREPGGSWRWRYVGRDADGKQVVLPANSPQESCDKAASAARVAYPDLPVQVQTPQGRGAATKAGRRRVSRPAVLAALVAGAGVARHRWGTAAAAALLAGLLVVRRRHRR